MKSNELRIGKTFIDVNGKYIVPSHLKENHFSWIIGIGKKGEKIYNPYIPYNHDKVNPIPITDDILLKCGFVNDGFEYKKDSFFFFYQSKDKNNICINTEFGKYRGDTRFVFSFHIEYLHQLQNIYFVLSNKELEVNI